MKKRSRQINEGVYVGTDTDLISVRDVLDIYLTWNGIIGYTDAIMEIIETGEAYISDMDDEDLSDVKRNLGIRDITLESVRRPKRRLKESSEEIDRKLFLSLIKYDVFDPKGNYAVLNDGNFCYAFWADNDEEAKKIFRKNGTKAPKVDSRGKARDITLESKERPNRRRLKESTEEIDRKLFGSLVKYSDPVFAGATHGVLNDGDLVYKFWARNDEDAKKVFQKFGVKGRPETDKQGYAIVESIRSKDELRREGLDFEFTVRNELGEVIGSSKSRKKAISMAKRDPEAKWVEYEEFTIDEGEPWHSEVVWGEMVDESLKESRQLNEGPGAGYEIKGKLENVAVNDITIEVEKETDNMIMYVATGDITATLSDVECHSYDYGGNIEETPVKIPRLIFTEDKGEEIGNKPTDSDIEDLLNSVEIKTTYGGGWSHSTFDGNLECEDYDIDWSMYATPYTPDLIDIVFTDKGAIFAIDKYATGDNYNAEYVVVDEDYEEVDYGYDNLDDAIEVAKETGMPYVREEKWYWEYNDGEYETVDSLFDSEIVWENEDLEAE